MAVGGGGERVPRGVWCLTIARWIVATVVAALAATVLLLVLTVGLRSESMGVSVNHGHFQVATVLWSIHEFNLSHYPNNHVDKTLPGASYRNDTLAVYRPVDHVDIWVSMNFRTPGCNGVPPRRRGTVVVSSYVTAVRVFDMPNAPSFLGMVRIDTLEPRPHREVCHYYHGVLDKWIRINNTMTLDYIAKTYGGRSEFTALLQVNTTTTTKDTTTRLVETTIHTHYCWPVSIGHSRSITAEAITCRPSRGIDYTAGSGVLGAPPPPLPPNSPPPPQICELCAHDHN